jgi:hypothetical protein
LPQLPNLYSGLTGLSGIAFKAAVYRSSCEKRIERALIFTRNFLPGGLRK